MIFKFRPLQAWKQRGLQSGCKPAGGDTVASKTVNEILQAERQAAVEQAHAQAKELIRQAREDVASLLAEQTNLARQEADVLRRETKEQAEEILRKMEQEGYRQASALRDGVQAKQLGAATTVIRCIIPQYPIEGRRSDGKM